MQVEENQMGYRAARDGPRYVQEELEWREKPCTSANLINVPAPTKDNAKRLLTVETTCLESKEEPGKNQFRNFAVQFQWSTSTLLPVITGTARIRQTDKTRNPQAWCNNSV